jgi:hypothetical protein
LVARERAVGYASLWGRDPRRLTRPSRRDGDRRGPVVARARARARADAPRRGRRAARLAARGAAWESVVLTRPCRDGASPRRITRIGRSHSAEQREYHITRAACPQAWPCTPVALFMWDGEVRDRTVRRATRDESRLRPLNERKTEKSGTARR